MLGVQWKFNLGITAGKVEEAEAELGKIQQKQALAEQGIPFQVRQAYLEVQQHQANIEATAKAFAVVGSGSWRRRRTLILGWGQARTWPMPLSPMQNYVPSIFRQSTITTLD